MEIYDSEKIRKTDLALLFDSPVTLYPESLTSLGECTLALVRFGSKKYLIAKGSGPIFDELEGELIGSLKRCPTNHANRLVLNTYLPYTKPTINSEGRPSIGLGDRLGEATAGHIKALEGTNVFPYFAQQSIRELNLTNRSFDEVIDSAAYAVFQMGYTAGWGADGDHLKKKEEIIHALACGATMITLDSSDLIDNTIASLNSAELEARYTSVAEATRYFYEELYQGHTIELGDTSLTIDRHSLMKDVLIYGQALDFIQMIWESVAAFKEGSAFLEVSIDETATPTDPKSHLFIALELKRRGVGLKTLAPRFVGEFQKGIDYIGNLAAFEEELIIHEAIALEFDYRLSIHSGSDKFSIFPLLAKHIDRPFHVKTAGTNWLEAMRVVALTDPVLYRRMHHHALERFEDATRFYMVTTDLSKIKSLGTVKDSELSAYLDDNNARQLLHITYGYLLQDKDEDGTYLFNDEFFALLAKEEALYQNLLEGHIGKHLVLLGWKNV
ncbi:MAG: tagaturonate epimerase family protein [Sphaerochaeta sp.]